MVAQMSNATAVGDPPIGCVTGCASICPNCGAHAWNCCVHTLSFIVVAESVQLSSRFFDPPPERPRHNDPRRRETPRSPKRRR